MSLELLKETVPWQIPLLLMLVCARILAPILIKRTATLPSRTRNLVYQYTFSAAIALLSALLLQSKHLVSAGSLIVFVMGIIIAFGCYAEWRAVDISLSATSIFTQLDDLIALTLAFTVLQEGRFLTLPLAVGLVLAIGSAVVLTRSSTTVKRTASPTKNRKQILIWVGFYSCIFGVAIFAQRYYSFSGMPFINFILAWYSGATIGAWIVRWLGGKKEAGPPPPLKQILSILPLSALLVISNLASLWAFHRAPLTVIQPIDQVAEMIFPTIIGLWFFKEKNQFNWLGKLAICTGIIGGLVIVFSY